jgi:hypothetical protein
MPTLDQAIQSIQQVAFPQPRPISVAQAEALDQLLSALTELQTTGRVTDPLALTHGIAAVCQIARGDVGGIPTLSHWQVGLQALPGLGGYTLILEDRQIAHQELRFNLDTQRRPYMASQRPMDSTAVVAFTVRAAAAGWELYVTDGQRDQRVPLGPVAPGFDWTYTPILSEATASVADLFTSIVQNPGQALWDYVSGRAVDIMIEKAADRIVEGRPAPAGPALTCTRCGHVNAPESKFCQNCGEKLSAPKTAFCGQCGQPLKPGAKFCTACGQAV